MTHVVQHKAGSDRKDFMKVGRLSGRSQGAPGAGGSASWMSGPCTCILVDRVRMQVWEKFSKADTHIPVSSIESGIVLYIEMFYFRMR